MYEIILPNLGIGEMNHNKDGNKVAVDDKNDYKFALPRLKHPTRRTTLPDPSIDLRTALWATTFVFRPRAIAVNSTVSMTTPKPNHQPRLRSMQSLARSFLISPQVRSVKYIHGNPNIGKSIFTP